VVDQGHPKYLERFRPLLSGGLAWLLDNGAVFTDAHHNHSMTATAPGHATLSTGLVPARSGIYSNYWYDVPAREEAYSAGDARDPSPVHLRGTTLGDWLKARDARSKVFTASRKDRSAVLMGGQNADAAYSYWGNDGTWWTGGYYPGPSSDWVTTFLAQGGATRYFGTLWEPLIEDEAVWAEYDVVQLDTGAFRSGFPHQIGSPEPEPDRSFFGWFSGTPMVDGYLSEFAQAMIDGEELGLDGSIDFLGVSFSAIDSVGHDYGPNSPEILDAVLRLDKYLGELIEHLDQTVGLEHVVFGFSADHGIPPLPEYQQLIDADGKRLDVWDVQCVQRAGVAFREKFGEDDWFLDNYYFDPDVVAAHGLTMAEVEEDMAARLEACPSVDKIWTATELAAIDPETASGMALLFRNSYVPGRTPNLNVQLKPLYQYYPGSGTTHGSPHWYDTHVPFILAGPGVKAGVIDQRVNTVDMAVTLAALIGLEPPSGLDGVDLSDLLP
jgi:predicted AlkP superfamily pyrophosphatase or phosphodiesterase